MTHRAHIDVYFSQVLEMWTMGRAPYIAYSFKDMSLLFNVSQASFCFSFFNISVLVETQNISFSPSTFAFRPSKWD